MNRSMTLVALLVLLATAFLAGCGDDDSSSPDTTAPTVSITSPTANAVVRDSVIVLATASDNRGIAHVDFYVDGVSRGTDTSSPYQWVWQLAGESFGAHVLQCRAHDTSGNEKTSAEVPVTVSDVIFAANFISDWLLTGEGTGLLFISSTDGTVLAETTWVSNRSIAVRPLPGVTEVPGLVDVTIVTQDAAQQKVSIVTNRSVMPSIWTWQGRERPAFGETPATIALVFANKPNHVGYVVSSPWAEDQSYTIGLPDQLDFPLHDQTNDLYVVYGTHSGAPKYKWFTGVTTGGAGQYAADLAGATTAGQKSVALPSGNTAHAARLYGFPEPGNHHGGVYLLSTTGSTASAENAVLYHPTNLTDFMSRILVDEAVDGETYWVETRTGTITELASAFTASDGDLQFASEDPDDFEVVVAGQVDQIRTYWKTASGGKEYRWFVYSSRSDKEYALPTLPTQFSQLFGAVGAEAFTLQYAELMDYPQLSNFDDVIAETFQGATPFADAIHTLRIKGRWSSTAEHGDPVGHHNNGRDAFGGQR